MPASVQLLYGDDQFLVDREARARVDKLCPPARQATELEMIDGDCSNSGEVLECLARLNESLFTANLFAAQKTIWLRGATFLNSSKDPGRSAEVKDQLATLADRVSSTSLAYPFVITATSVYKASAFYKAIDKMGETVEFKKPRYGEKEAKTLVDKQLKQLGVNLSTSLLDAFVLRAGTDSRQLIQEAEKLAAYTGGEDITLQDLRLMVSPTRESIAWDLADAAGNRNAVQASELVRHLLAQGESAVGLIIGVINRFRDLVVLRACLDHGWVRGGGRGVDWSPDPDAENFLSRQQSDPRNMHPYRLGRLLDQAKKFSLRELKTRRRLLVDAHAQMVSSLTDPGFLLEFSVMRAASARRR